jgi:hypothetical protein
MLERLCEAAREELRLGLLSPALARQLTRLPMGNPTAVLQTTREASLTSTKLAGVVDLVLATRTREQVDFVLSDPRNALRQSEQRYMHQWGPTYEHRGQSHRQAFGIVIGPPSQNANVAGLSGSRRPAGLRCRTSQRWPQPVGRRMPTGGGGN